MHVACMTIPASKGTECHLTLLKKAIKHLLFPYKPARYPCADALVLYSPDPSKQPALLAQLQLASFVPDLQQRARWAEELSHLRRSCSSLWGW